MLRAAVTTRTAEDHARLIRRAIADAVADGFVVDFDWVGHLRGGTMSLKVVHEGTNWKEAVQVWPIL